MIGLGLALPYAGFAALCLAMERHCQQVLGRHRLPPGQRRALQVVGWLLLVASPLPSIAWLGWGAGSVLWCGLLSAALLPLALLLAYAPRLLMPTAGLGLGLGLLAWLFGS